jgi:hypothetical protein
VVRVKRKPHPLHGQTNKQTKQQNTPFNPNYIPQEVGLVEAPFLDDLIGFGSGFGLGILTALFGKTVPSKILKILKSKSAEKVVEKEAQKVAENVAKETAQNVVSQPVKTEAENVATQMSKYDLKRQELKKRIGEQMKKEKERARKSFGRSMGKTNTI